MSARVDAGLVKKALAHRACEVFNIEKTATIATTETTEATASPTSAGLACSINFSNFSSVLLYDGSLQSRLFFAK